MAGTPTDPLDLQGDLHAARDADVARAAGVTLRIGVIIAAVLTAIGGVMLLLQGPSTPADYRVFQGEPAELTSVHTAVAGAWHLHGAAIAQLGLIVLVATPIMRVLVTLVAFVKQRDRLYVGLTGIVFAILLFSFVFGGRM